MWRPVGHPLLYYSSAVNNIMKPAFGYGQQQSAKMLDLVTFYCWVYHLIFYAFDGFAPSYLNGMKFAAQYIV